MRLETRWTHDVIITSLLRQNDVATSFWSDNDVIFTSCDRWGVFMIPNCLTGGSTGCRYDSLWCHQRRWSWHHGDSPFSVYAGSQSYRCAPWISLKRLTNYTSTTQWQLKICQLGSRNKFINKIMLMASQIACNSFLGSKPYSVYQKRETSKLRITGPLWWESTGDPLTKGWKRGKLIHVMPSVIIDRCRGLLPFALRMMLCDQNSSLSIHDQIKSTRHCDSYRSVKKGKHLQARRTSCFWALR